MRAQFVELPAFERSRAEHLDDHAFLELQRILLTHPAAGAVIEGSGGLRVIYYWWEVGSQFWLFAVYDKGATDDLSPQQRRRLKAMAKTELAARTLQ